jgi:hypothetical protein
MKTTPASAPDDVDEHLEIDGQILKLKQDWKGIPSSDRTRIIKSILAGGDYSIRRLAKRVGRDEGTLRNCLKKHARQADNIHPDTKPLKTAACAVASQLPNFAADEGLRLKPDWKERLEKHMSSGWEHWDDYEEPAPVTVCESNSRLEELISASQQFLRFQLPCGQPSLSQLLELVKDRVSYCEYFGLRVVPAPENSDPSSEIAKAYRLETEAIELESRVAQLTLALFRLAPKPAMREQILRSLLHSFDPRYPAPTGFPG